MVSSVLVLQVPLQLFIRPLVFFFAGLGGDESYRDDLVIHDTLKSSIVIVYVIYSKYYLLQKCNLRVDDVLLSWIYYKLCKNFTRPKATGTFRWCPFPRWLSYTLFVFRYFLVLFRTYYTGTADYPVTFRKSVFHVPHFKHQHCRIFNLWRCVMDGPAMKNGDFQASSVGDRIYQLLKVL